jgi:peptidoglycan/LPS O-acetylase OafA/YrhL
MTGTDSTLSQPKYRPDIDGLRAVAVLAVIFFHAFPNLLQGGFIGVDIFFVISGFLISTIIFENLMKNTFSFAEFYARRIKRIFPSLIIILIAIFGFGWMILFAKEYEQLGKHIAGGAGFISNFILLHEEGYFNNAAETKPLLHLWSLGIEEQFYIIWPLLIWMAWRLRLNLYALIIFVGLVSFGLNITWIEKDAVNTFYSPQSRFWELLAGSLLALLTCNQKITIKKNWSNFLSFGGTLCIILGFLLIDKKSSFPGTWAVLPVFGAVFLIMSGANAWINKNILSNRILIWFGLISFPLYLWHWPLLSFMRILKGQEPSLIVRLAAVLLSILLAWISYKFIEQPIRHGPSTKSKILTLVSLMVFIGIVGYTTMINKGFGFRHKDIKKNVDQLNYFFPNSDNCKKLRPYVPNCYESPRKYSQTVLLMGDSHMAVLTSGFKELFEESRLKFNVLAVGESSCSYFLNTERIFPNGSIKGCKKIFTNIINEAVKRPDIKYVIIAGRHAERFSGTGFGSIEKNKIGTYRYQTDGKVSRTNEEAFELGFQDTLNELNKANKKIIFVHHLPELGFYPRSCLRKPPKFLQNKCKISREVVNKRLNPYKKVVTRIARHYPDLIQIDPINQVCDKKACFPFNKDGELIYRDDNHISKIGARNLANLINEQLKI